jgi:hypothetical protein
MRCPCCNADNADVATECATCKGPLTAPARRKPRRRSAGDDLDSPFARGVPGPNGVALRVYQLSVYGLMPGLGLFLGPLALVRALVVRRRYRDDPAFTAHNPVKAAIILGSLVALTNWLGLGLMVLGLMNNP